MIICAPPASPPPPRPARRIAVTLHRKNYNKGLIIIII